MKIKFLFLTLCFILIFNLPVSAESKGYIVEIPDEFYVSYGNSKDDMVAKIIGMDQEKYDNYFTANGILFIAVKEDNSVQIRFSKYRNEFSEKLGNLSNLNENEFSEIAQKLSKEKAYSRATAGQQPFIAISETLKDSGGEYTSTQYITVKNGYIYQLSCYNKGSAVSNEVEKVFNSLRFSESGNYNWLYTMIILASMILGGVILVMIRGIIKDLKKRNNGKSLK